jgi:glycosyltransferase involved in cell wall biosynthesis
MRLSVIIPAFNEVDSLPKILAKVVLALPQVEKEIVIIDDCSTDGTRAWLTAHIGDQPRIARVDETGQLILGDDSDRADQPSAQVRAMFHAVNRGKGAALRTGFGACTGAVVVIQDADLEYDPADWERFWPLFTNDLADVVYGTRFLTSLPHRCLFYHHYFANKLISLLFSIFYNQILSDLEVCYKMFRRDVLDILTLRSNDFGFEIEFSANVALARRLRIYELGISYYGRTYAEGKKINWKDGVKALWYLVRFRFI